VQVWDPLVALSYLTGECNYGGRVTDDRDRRLIISLLKIFYNSDVLNDKQHTFSPSGLYYVPEFGKHQVYLEYVRSLPLIPHPEVCRYAYTYLSYVHVYSIYG
jgi:dynein heavy chain